MKPRLFPLLQYFQIPCFSVAKIASALSLLLLSCYAHASSEYELPELNLEDLMDINITSVAKKSQKLSEAPSAVYVISQEEIRRGGATSLPEILRMAPGVHVARIDAGKWSVSIRGFSGVFSNKLLVLMDGRTLYSPLFSGVYWEEQDIVLEDIERIEIIRGPGASVWGANAVNGVINIISKHAAETRYGRFSAHSGNLDKGGSLRYGWGLSADTQARAYLKYSRKQDARLAGGGDDAVQLGAWYAGARVDTLATPKDHISLLLDARKGETERRVSLLSWLEPRRVIDTTDKFQGGSLLLRWRHDEGGGREIEVQSYIERSMRRTSTLDQNITSFSTEFQQRLPLGDIHDFIWGLGYTRNQDKLDGSFGVSVNPNTRTAEVYSLFLQDEICAGEKLCFTLGSKFEYNDYSDFEYQPSARLLWKFQEQGMLWAAVSRAVHTPSRFDHDSRLNVANVPGDPPTLISLFGNDGVKAENVLTWEAGYRGRLQNTLSLDAALFYNQYTDLKTREGNPPAFEDNPPPRHVLISSTTRNLMEGENYGAELSLVWQARRNWRLKAGINRLYSEMRLRGGSGDEARVPRIEGDSPSWQLKLQSYWKLSESLEFDALYYYSDDLPVYDLPSYSRLDLRLGWQAGGGLEFTLAANNVLNDKHVEYESQDASIPAEVSRGLYAELLWRF